MALVATTAIGVWVANCRGPLSAMLGSLQLLLSLSTSVAAEQLGQW